MFLEDNQNPDFFIELKLLQEKDKLLKTTGEFIERYGVEMMQLMLGYSQKKPSPETEIVIGSYEARSLLIEALEIAESRIIVVCPWLSRKSINDDMVLKICAFLDRGGRLDIGWGYQYDIGNPIKFNRDGNVYINPKIDESHKYNAYPELAKLRKDYPQQLQLKLLGTHAKYFTCDLKFAYVGSKNVLSAFGSSVESSDRHSVIDELGMLERSPRNIQKLIQLFDRDFHRRGEKCRSPMLDIPNIEVQFLKTR